MYSIYMLHITSFNDFRFAVVQLEFNWKMIIYYPLLRLLDLYHILLYSVSE